MSQRMIKIRVRGAKTLPLDAIFPFQQEIKSLSKEAYESLRQSLISEGMGLALHVWKNPEDSVFYAIDGHQRIWALKKMRDEEGWVIPELPVAEIDADSYEEAKRRVLIALSVSGKVKEREFADYVKENNISAEYLILHVTPPGVDMQAFIDHYMNITPITDIKLPEIQAPTKLASSSLQVKQIQLFFDAPSLEEFNGCVNALSSHYGTENITDTVMEAVRAAHHAEFGA